MELTILHLYPDCMSLYGEYANVAVLRRHLESLTDEAREETVTPGGTEVVRTRREPLFTVRVKTVLFEDTPDFAHADFIYMGAGTERSQKAALTALLPHREAFRAAILDRQVVTLFTGNAMELLGESITDAGGKVWPCLGALSFTTEETDRRITGDVVTAPAVLLQTPDNPTAPPLALPPTVGFMNKCSVSRPGGPHCLFPSLKMGFGNEAEKGPEGYQFKNVFATHLAGPALVKNPHLTNGLVKRLLAQKGLPDRAVYMWDEMKAYEATLEELTARAEE